MRTKTVAVIAMTMLMLVPMGFAQNVGANASANASAEASVDAPSEFRLEIKQFSETVSDTFFNIRMRLTQDSETKVDLIKDRNEALKERQKEWVEIKNSIQQSSDLSNEERQRLRAEVQQEHQALIKKHVELTHSLQEISARAESEGNANVSQRARAEFESSSRSGLSRGLEIEVESSEEGKFELELEGTDELPETEFEVESEENEIKTKAEFGLNHSGYVISNRSIEVDSENKTIKIQVDLTSQEVVGAQVLTEAELEHEMRVGSGNWTVSLVVTEDGNIVLDESSVVSVEGEAEANVTVTREEAIEKAESFDMVVTEAELDDGVWEVEGERVVTFGSVSVTTETEIKIDARTGAVLSVEIEGRTHAEIETEEEQELETSAEGSATASAGIGIGQRADAEVESETEVKAQGIGAKVRAFVSLGA